MSAFVTDEELENLPRWAKVAFAARCARRILPVFLDWHTESEHADAIQQAILAAENCAAKANADVRAVAAIRDGTRDAVNAATLAMANVDYAAFGALAAAMAAVRATEAAIAASYGNAHSINLATQAAVNAAVNASGNIRGDFNKLVLAVKTKHWDDDSPVPRAFFAQPPSVS